jgi:hypothetical protein
MDIHNKFTATPIRALDATTRPLTIGGLDTRALEATTRPLTIIGLERCSIIAAARNRVMGMTAPPH